MGWSDGLPVVAPTPPRVEAMLGGADRPPDHELGFMAPRRGVVSAETLAVNAVMAGCRPDHFAVVLTAFDAMLDPAFNLFAVQSTTHPCSPLVIVNGPIAAELGVNARYGAFGPGVRANATIGRAVRLGLLNIGGAAPGVLDRSTQGQPSKYSFCVAENEAESPWEPLHVERGIEPGYSAVTVVGCENPHNINDHVSIDADGILTTVAGSMANMGSNNAYLHGGPVLALGPEHAAIVAAAGLSKDDVRQYVFDEARIPRHIWERGGMARMAGDPFAAESAVPIIRRPEDLLIMVVGGFGRHSSWLPTFGGSTQAVTRPIADISGAPIRSVLDLR
ncbi:MAG: hypothetical protein GY724_03190 [Actinomycetia bacterium]|nr:hypothetical protein [Actinomycetes bacterium]MCP4226130.1 hypothetical protein [Actinomycetes bacterium]MCP5033001.1 hypothetical protein [Actinomycetes bacterium]